MWNQKRLNDVFTMPGGIFTFLQNYDVPWKSENMHAELDAEYHFNTAGQRYISPLVRQYLGEAETLTDEQKTALAGIIYSMHAMKWAKLWATLEFTYNPIENYDMTEEMQDDTTKDTYGRTDTRTITYGKKTEDKTDIQGFDSTEYKPADKFTEDLSGSDIDENAAGGSDTREHSYTLTRHGNIGVTTSQQMIESERNLWVLWQYFYDVVFPDINRVLTLSIY